MNKKLHNQEFHCPHTQTIHTYQKYIRLLNKVGNYNTKPALFASDTSIIVSNPNLVEF
jgi:hypothetical protein